MIFAAANKISVLQLCRRMKKQIFRAAIQAAAAVFLSIAAFISPAIAANRPAAQAFAAIHTPAAGAADSIGFYAKGCLRGAQQLPMTAPSWQILHPSRRRNWGHPTMIYFLRNLALQARTQGWSGLLIGDISQARGGPLPFGHSSHQIGLDADIWFTPMPPRGLSLQAREDMKGGSVLRDKTLLIDPRKWSNAHTNLLKSAALSPQTDRIFVHPGIKKYLCEKTAGDKTWLHKIRPYWGHFEHFHVRLKCPSGSAECQVQQPPPKGSGCDSSLDWWFGRTPWVKKKPPSALTLKKPGGKKTMPKIMMVSDLPKPCQALAQ